MKPHITARLWAKTIAILAVVTGTGDLEASPLVDYRAQGNQEVASLDAGGVTVTGSGTLSIDDDHGLGVLGGVPGFPYLDHTIDATESVTFRFDGGPARDIAVSWTMAGGYSFANEGEFAVEAFGASGDSLGTVDMKPMFPQPKIDISSRFSDQPITSFRLQPTGDAINYNFLTIGGLDYATVPEPATISLLGLGIACYSIRGALERCTHGWRTATRGRSSS